jgi:putative endonuclease
MAAPPHRPPADPPPDGGFAGAPHNRGRGAAAEVEAVAWLEGQGYSVVERNVRTDAGEIDLVARERGTLCFVEIKARTGDLYGPAIAAVDARKQRRLARAAALYLSWHPTGDPCRFDVLGIDPGPDGGWEYTLIRDAFRL